MSFRPVVKPDATKQYEPRFRSMPQGNKEMSAETRAKTLYVGNLDKRISEKHLIQLFSQFGELERVQMTWHHHGELRGQPRGFGFVEFKEKSSAALASSQANGAPLAGRPLVVRFADDKQDKDELQVDFKSTGERKRAEIGARASAYESGRGGPPNRKREEFDRYAYVPAKVPTSGLGAAIESAAAASSSSSSSKANIGLSSAAVAAVAKVRAIEDKLKAMEEERLFDRKRAQRDMISLHPSTSTKTSSAAASASSSLSSSSQNLSNSSSTNPHETSNSDRKRKRTPSPEAQNKK